MDNVPVPWKGWAQTKFYACLCTLTRLVCVGPYELWTSSLGSLQTLVCHHQEELSAPWNRSECQQKGNQRSIPVTPIKINSLHMTNQNQCPNCSDCMYNCIYIYIYIYLYMKMDHCLGDTFIELFYLWHSVPLDIHPIVWISRTIKLIQSLGCLLQSFNETIQSLGCLLQSFNETIQSLLCLLQSFNETIQSLLCLLQSFNETIQSLGCLLQSINETIQSLGCLVQSFNETIQSLGCLLQSFNETIESLGCLLQSFNETIQSLGCLLQRFNFHKFV